MSIDASAKNMAAIVAAKKQHDSTCRFGGNAQHVHLAPFDIDRLGWEEGDNIAGLTVVSDESMQTGRMRVTCDAEPSGDNESEMSEEPEVVEAVSRERELITTGS